jgi:hypothetical protein
MTDAWKYPLYFAGIVVCCTLLFVLVSDSARWSVPYPRVCETGEAVSLTGEPDSCVCDGFLYTDHEGQLRCGGRCLDGYGLKEDTPDGTPVCVRKETVDDRLDRLERKLDAVSGHVTTRAGSGTVSNLWGDGLTFSPPPATPGDCFRVTPSWVIEKVEACGCQERTTP